MGVLCLLSITVICQSIQHITAWPGGNQTVSTIISTKENVLDNRTTGIRNELPERKPTFNDSGENLREKRGTLANENNIDAELEKRDPMKYRFPSWAHLPEGKRAKFSSWGGKRSNDIENDEDTEEQKRARFSSWGGKRSDNELEKRAKFSSWAGKRDFNEFAEDKRSKFNSWAGKRMDLGDNKRAKFSSWAGKRARFNSWAGKRSDDTLFTDDKRTPFNSWAGKRSIFIPANEEEISEDKRAKFSSWAGKRTPDYVGIAWNQNTPYNRLRYYSNGGDVSGSENIMKLWQDLMSRKRARFSSWAGKRSTESIPDVESLASRFQEPETEEMSAKFPWVDKTYESNTNKYINSNESNNSPMIDREGYPGVIVKRSVFSWNSPSVAYKRKPIFSSWGGKRNDDSHTIQARSLPMQRVLINGVKDKSWGSLLRPIRRGPDFYAWGGKRST